MTLTKEQIINAVQEFLHIPRNRSTTYVESMLEIMKRTLENGDDLLISGFGKFCLKEKRERRGRNPQTGEDLTLGSRKVVIFRCSRILREKINGK